MAVFEFVVTTGAPQKATAAVRSHAVRSGLERKCAAHDAGSLKDSQLVIRQKSRLKGRFRLSPINAKEAPPKATKGTVDPPLKERLRTPSKRTKNSLEDTDLDRWELSRYNSYSLAKAPSQSWGDPFSTLPITHSQGMDNLVKYFFSSLELDVSLAQLSNLWWDFAVSDPLVLHTTLGIVAVEWGMMVPNPKLAYREGIQQKALALPGIQARLKKNDLGDAVVGAIANLASMEGLSGDYDAAAIHLKALESIVKARGGFSTFGDDKNFSASINWPDLIVAVGKGTRPTFPLIHDWDSVSLPARILTAAEQPSLSHLEAFEATPAATTIRFTFCLLRQALHAVRSGQVSTQDLRILFNSVDFRIANLLCFSGTAPVWHMLLATAQLFLACNIRDTHIECLIPGILGRRLMRYLQGRMEKILRQEAYWCGTLWSLLTCFISSPSNSEQWSFFRDALSITIETMGLTEATQLRAISQRFIWDDERSERALQANMPIFFPHVDR